MERGRPKSRIGIVTSNKMDKTAVVRVDRRVRHAKYGKIVVRHVS
jgi:small subunit ribosomal protein S17